MNSLGSAFRCEDVFDLWFWDAIINCKESGNASSDEGDTKRMAIAPCTNDLLQIGLSPLGSIGVDAWQ